MKAGSGSKVGAAAEYKANEDVNRSEIGLAMVGPFQSQFVIVYRLKANIRIVLEMDQSRVF